MRATPMTEEVEVEHRLAVVVAHCSPEVALECQKVVEVVPVDCTVATCPTIQGEQAEGLHIQTDRSSDSRRTHNCHLVEAAVAKEQHYCQVQRRTRRSCLDHGSAEPKELVQKRCHSYLVARVAMAQLLQRVALEPRDGSLLHHRTSHLDPKVPVVPQCDLLVRLTGCRTVPA